MHLILSLTALAIALGLADQLLSNLLLLSPAHTRHSAHEPQGLLSPGVQTAAPGRACQGPGLAVQVSDTGGCTSQARWQRLLQRVAYRVAYRAGAGSAHRYAVDRGEEANSHTSCNFQNMAPRSPATVAANGQGHLLL